MSPLVIKVEYVQTYCVLSLYLLRMLRIILGLQMVYLVYILIMLYLPAETFQRWYVGHTFEYVCLEGDEHTYDYKDWFWKPHAWFKEMIFVVIFLMYFLQTFEWYVMNNLIRE